jgi:DinB superfamily
MTSHELPVKVAISSWRLVVDRAGTIFSGLTEEQLFREVAPGKNRVIYLLGHLIAVHDRMFSILGLGPRLHPDLDALFIDNSDKLVAEIPSGGLLKQYWDEINEKLLSQFQNLSADEWLLQHHAMSEEDYAKDPTRNRLAVLLSRTNHLSYHLGQVMLALK